MSLFIDEVVEENARLKERIEELEEELRVAREHSNNMDWYNDNQYQLLNKYKKVIEILKKKKAFNLVFESENERPYRLYLHNSLSYYSLTKEEYEILKEVFGDE